MLTVKLERELDLRLHYHYNLSTIADFNGDVKHLRVFETHQG